MSQEETQVILNWTSPQMCSQRAEKENIYSKGQPKTQALPQLKWMHSFLSLQENQQLRDGRRGLWMLSG